MSRKMKIIFTISVLLNVLFFGLAAGQGYRAAHRYDWNELKKDLAPETRAIMKKTFSERRKEFGPMIREMRENIEVVGGILTAEEFDPQAFDAATESLKEANGTIYAHKLETMKILASQLPQAEREKLKKKFMFLLMNKRPSHRKPEDREKDSKEKNIGSPSSERM